MSSIFRRLIDVLPKTVPTQIFLAATACETVVDIAIVAALLSSVGGGTDDTVLAMDQSSVLPVYLGLFVLAHLFQLVLALDALAAKNTIQIIGLLCFNTLFLAYSIVQIVEIDGLPRVQALGSLVWFIPVMIGLTELAYLSTLWRIYRDFGWMVYKRIGADRGLKKMFMWYQFFICILKFDFYLFISFSVQLVLLVPQTELERGLTIAALPCTLAFLLLGYFSVRKETKPLFFVFCIACVAGAAYFVFKLFRIYSQRATDYYLVFKSLTLFAALCLAALVWTGITATICARSFGRGLRQAMENTARSNLNELPDGTYMLESAKNSRMSMD